MKYVFVLVLLLVGGVASVLGLNVGYRWFHNMTESARVMPGERAFSMPPGSVPRGGELRLPKEEREAAALRRSALRCEGVNFFLADGVSAFQEVMHVHLHVIPRWKGDGFTLGFKAGKPSRADLDANAAELRVAYERLALAEE